MNITQEQIEKYSELMAKMDVVEIENHWNPSQPIIPNYIGDRNLLHRVWEKFRDLKLDRLDNSYYGHRDLCEMIGRYIAYKSLEEAFLELGKGLEWYYSLKNETFEKP